VEIGTGYRWRLRLFFFLSLRSVERGCGGRHGRKNES
jgi:hypothetical protein